MGVASIARRRLAAWAVDVLLACGVLLMLPTGGGVLGFVYLLLRDGFFSGQSVGKRIMSLKVVNDEGRNLYAASAMRNALWFVPVLQVVFAVTGLYVLFHDAEGRHWGDRLAGTRVVSA